MVGSQLRIDRIFHDALFVETSVKNGWVFRIMLEHVGIDHLFGPAIGRPFVILITRLRVPMNGGDGLLMFVDEAD